MVCLISCKNDYPPVKRYKVQIFNGTQELPFYLDDLNLDAPWRQEKIVVKGNKLYFCCICKDPVEAMIKFWGAYICMRDIT